MTTAPHIQVVLDRIDAEMAQAHRAAKRFHVLDGAARYEGDARVRAQTLQRLEISDGTPATVIAQAKARLLLDREIRRHRPLWAPAPIHRWALIAVWLGERRLARARAARPAPIATPFQLAAE